MNTAEPVGVYANAAATFRHVRVLRCSRARVILLSSRRLYMCIYIHTYTQYIYRFMRGSTRVEKGMEKPREGSFRAEKEETLVRIGKEREIARKGMR